MVRSTGGTPRRLTGGEGDGVNPRWSRDGRSLYFWATRGGQAQTWRVELDGGEPAQVTRDGGGVCYQSEDGADLYYTKDRSSGIWRMPLSGGPEELVLDRQVDYASWFLFEDQLYFMTGKWEGDTYDWKIEVLDPRTGEISLFREGQNEGEGVRIMNISRSGEWIVARGLSREEADIMYVENFR